MAMEQKRYSASRRLSHVFSVRCLQCGVCGRGFDYSQDKLRHQEFCAATTQKLQPKVVLERLSVVESMLKEQARASEASRAATTAAGDRKKDLVKTRDEVLKHAPSSSGSSSSSGGNSNGSSNAGSGGEEEEDQQDQERGGDGEEGATDDCRSSEPAKKVKRKGMRSLRVVVKDEIEELERKFRLQRQQQRIREELEGSIKKENGDEEVIDVDGEDGDDDEDEVSFSSKSSYATPGGTGIDCSDNGLGRGKRRKRSPLRLVETEVPPTSSNGVEKRGAKRGRPPASACAPPSSSSSSSSRSGSATPECNGAENGSESDSSVASSSAFGRTRSHRSATPDGGGGRGSGRSRAGPACRKSKAETPSPPSPERKARRVERRQDVAASRK